MIKEALQYIVGFANTRLETVNGQTYSTQPMHEIEVPRAAGLVVNNLTGLVDYLKENYDGLDPVLIQVASPTTVNVYSTFNNDMKRDHFLQAKALLPDITFERYMSTESFNIQLMSSFVDACDRATVLKVTGNVTEASSRKTADDGVTQTVTAKAGISLEENIVVPNPVALKPFRTFCEVEQPASSFVLRMKEGPQAALFEADGGAWKLLAIHSVRDYLKEQLADEIASNFVTIIA